MNSVNTKLRERRQTRESTYCRTAFIGNAQKLARQKANQRRPAGWGRGAGVAGCGVSSGGNENVLKLTVMTDVQFCEKLNCSLYTGEMYVNYISIELFKKFQMVR